MRLPDPALCKGRVYKIVVNNKRNQFVNSVLAPINTGQGAGHYTSQGNLSIDGAFMGQAIRIYYNPTLTPAGYPFRRLVSQTFITDGVITDGTLNDNFPSPSITSNTYNHTLVFDGRMTVLMSDGVEWKEIQNDVFDVRQY